MSSFHKHNSILVGAVFGLWFFSSSVLVGESSGKGWMVQLGSFHEEKNAELFVARIKKKGYTPFVVRKENSKWYKIRVGPYPSKSEANQVAKDLKKKQGISAMVVLSQGGLPDSDDPGDSIDVVVSQLLIWLKAWEARKVNDYLSFYSQKFKDPKKSRQEWARQRRSALNGNSSISIEISNIQIKQNDETVEMSFIQNFKSDKVSDVGKKELVWVNEGNSWKIIQEVWKPS
ncbi:MAG: SPOR domain-containing protein [Nitrospina sp.]|jgi:hypothetical protein|nr:SPOR domain-containing protein [Nitrospina sp.]